MPCPLSSSTALATGDIFGGISVEQKKVTSSHTSDGSVKCSVARNGVWGFAKGSLAQTDIGAPAYASDDTTVTTTATNNMWIGHIVEVDATYVWVDITPAVGRPNLATYG